MNELSRFREDLVIKRTIDLDKNQSDLDELKVKVRELEKLLERDGYK